METICLNSKLEYLNELKEERLRELKSKGVKAWVNQETKVFLEPQEAVVQYIQNTFFDWLLAQERYEDLAWLKTELENI
jgi:hypothetical protein